VIPRSHDSILSLAEMMACDANKDCEIKHGAFAQRLHINSSSYTFGSLIQQQTHCHTDQKPNFKGFCAAQRESDMDDFAAWEDEYLEVKNRATKAINAIKANPGQLSQHQRAVEVG
jgi:hypothetical protein